jgi:ribonuclease BN (tRNA processing enzyme)
MAAYSRRRFIQCSTGMLGMAVTGFGGVATAQESKRTRLILLGTQGGPALVKGGRKSPSQVIVINDVPYVIDCGYGVAGQLVNAGITLNRLRHVFITHHHSDHDAEFGNLVFLSWSSGLNGQVDAYGPPPLAEMTRLIWETNRFDIETRIVDQGRSDPRKMLVAHEVTAGGVVLENADVKVTAARVLHPPIDHAYAYRFDAKDRSIVISGDTAYSEDLIALAKGADVLVHEAMYLPHMEKLFAGNSNGAALLKRVQTTHTTPEGVGMVAAKAQVKTVVLSHLLNTRPGDGVTDEIWADGVRKHFSGEVIVGRDLLEI